LNPMMVKIEPKRRRYAELPFLILRRGSGRISWQTLTWLIAFSEKHSIPTWQFLEDLGNA